MEFSCTLWVNCHKTAMCASFGIFGMHGSWKCVQSFPCFVQNVYRNQKFHGKGAIYFWLLGVLSTLINFWSFFVLLGCVASSFHPAIGWWQWERSSIGSRVHKHPCHMGPMAVGSTYSAHRVQVANERFMLGSPTKNAMIVVKWLLLSWGFEPYGSKFHPILKDISSW